ncbi:hypothetical protein DHEL01_v209662 [Diaporthe helianthi]|uniref:Uncharacterized protein n=1 Tax=Diaporthe helianthi TaxID=158607 RepID=A0A2P5HNY3_DIAHE|nr:hypothetical protein DHEL01_v209662 [Diaporthe helianthi]
MEPDILSQRSPSRVSADSDPDHAPSFLTTVIRRDQMPEDLRPEFLPDDIILINEPRSTDSTASQTLAQARQRLAAVDSGCPPNRAPDTCRRSVAVLVGLVFLGASAILGRSALVLLALYSFSCAGCWLHTTLLNVGQAETDNRVGRSCSRVDVVEHHLANLAKHILSPSSILLLQQPTLNIRSFIRYHQFYTDAKGKAGGVFQQEVDSCIRAYKAQGTLAIEALATGGTKALLGLEPCDEEFKCVGYCFSWPTTLYQNYRDWKRWRLATVLCERIQGGESEFLPLSVMDGHDPLGELEGRGGHKWFLVDPEVFSARTRRRVGDWVSTSGNKSH